MGAACPGRSVALTPLIHRSCRPWYVLWRPAYRPPSTDSTALPVYSQHSLCKSTHTIPKLSSHHTAITTAQVNTHNSKTVYSHHTAVTTVQVNTHYSKTVYSEHIADTNCASQHLIHKLCTVNTAHLQITQVKTEYTQTVCSHHTQKLCSQHSTFTNCESQHRLFTNCTVNSVRSRTT